MRPRCSAQGAASAARPSSHWSAGRPAAPRSRLCAASRRASRLARRPTLPCSAGAASASRAAPAIRHALPSLSIGRSWRSQVAGRLAGLVYAAGAATIALPALRFLPLHPGRRLAYAVRVAKRRKANVRAVPALLALILLGGCAGYASDYWKPKQKLIAPQLARYAMSSEQSQCVERRLTQTLSVWQLRQLGDLA